MSGYIKKVGTTPVRGNGFIIDSFHTNDNKALNAPSLNAVEGRTDNNLLYMGFLGSMSDGGVTSDTGASSCGWKYSRATGNAAFAGFAPVNGFMAMGGAKGVLQAPMISEFSVNTKAYLGYTSGSNFSLSFLFMSISNPIGEDIPLTLGKIENVTYLNREEKVFNYDDKLKISVATITEGGYFRINIECPDSQYGFAIPYIKLEYGATATKMHYANPLIGVQDAIEQRVDKGLSSYFLVKEFTFEAASVSAGSQYTNTKVIDATDDVSGYTPIGIIGFDSGASAVSLVKSKILYLTGHYRASMSVYNSGASSATATIYIRVLYVKGDFTIL